MGRQQQLIQPQRVVDVMVLCGDRRLGNAKDDDANDDDTRGRFDIVAVKVGVVEVRNAVVVVGKRMVVVVYSFEMKTNSNTTTTTTATTTSVKQRSRSVRKRRILSQ